MRQTRRTLLLKQQSATPHRQEGKPGRFRWPLYGRNRRTEDRPPAAPPTAPAAHAGSPPRPRHVRQLEAIDPVIRPTKHYRHLGHTRHIAGPEIAVLPT